MENSWSKLSRLQKCAKSKGISSASEINILHDMNTKTFQINTEQGEIVCQLNCHNILLNAISAPVSEN